jgi:hypothetical protein
VALTLEQVSTSGCEFDPALLADRNRIDEIEERLAQVEKERQADLESIADVSRRLSLLDSALAEFEVLQARVESVSSQITELLEADSPYIELKLDANRLAEARRALHEYSRMRQSAISERALKVAEISKERDKVTERLELADAEREGHRRHVDHLNERLRQITGQDDDPETIAGLERLLLDAEHVPVDIRDSHAKILLASRRMHELLLEKLAVIKQLYEPAATFVAEDPLAHEAAIQFEAELTVSKVWDEFTDSLDGRRTPELQNYLTNQRTSINTESSEDVEALVTEVLDRLPRERGGSAERSRELRSAFRSNADAVQAISDFVALKWLSPHFGITDDGVQLSQLSPGQRGLILLLFYLLVDRSGLPLLIDQPEENLDNDAVRRLLVPALKKARMRRQIIVVTHNANLAVVGDADQIIVCSQRHKSFFVESGSLAGRKTGEVTIDVLEGSRPAFQNRRNKYETVVGP